MNGIKKLNFVSVAVLIVLGLFAAGCASTKEPRLRGFNDDEVETLMAEQRARMDEGDPVVKAAQDPASLERHGDSLAMRNEYVAAFFEYGRAFKLTKNDVIKERLRRKMALISLRGGNYTEAESQFNSLIKLNSADGFAWQGLGLALLSQVRPDEALEALNKAVELDPRLWKAQNGRGIVFNRQGEPAKALAAFDAALKVHRGSAAVYNNQGLALMMTGQLRQAEDSFQRALRINPGYVQASNNLALAYFKQGKVGMALPVFEKTMGPAKARNNLGCLLAWQGNYEKAAEMFNAAVEISPTYYKLAADHYEEVRYKAGTAVKSTRGQARGNNSALAAAQKVNSLEQPKLVEPKKRTDIKISVDKSVETKTQLIDRAKVMQSINSLRPKEVKAKSKAEPVAKAKAPSEKAKAEVRTEPQGHFIQVASMSSAKRAENCVRSWKKRGVMGHVEQWRAANGKKWYRVLLGPFNTKAEAEAKANQLRGQGRIREFLLVDRGNTSIGAPVRAMASLK